jgi:hypothetical protein
VEVAVHLIAGSDLPLKKAGTSLRPNESTSGSTKIHLCSEQLSYQQECEAKELNGLDLCILQDVEPEQRVAQLGKERTTNNEHEVHE